MNKWWIVADFPSFLKVQLKTLFQQSISTVEDLLLFNRNKIFGQTQSDSTKKTIPSYNLMIFYVFKMAIAIAFLCENTVETI